MSDAKRFHGTFTALVTPFTAAGAIDRDALKRLVQAQIAAGVQGIVLLGTTGESPTVTDLEREELTRSAVEMAKSRMRVIIGTGTNDTERCMRDSRRAEALGADAVLVVSPYYNKPTQPGLLAHFRAIADAIEIPVILYNIAGRTAVNLATETLLKLAEHPRIIGVKEASGDIQQIMDVIDQSPPDFLVLSGDDSLTFPLLSLGGDGVISVLSNLLPADVVTMVNAALANDWKTAREMHFRLLGMMRACNLETNPIPIKTALAIRGHIQEQFRLPLCPMAADNRRKLEELVTGYLRS
jgi:4-hydroxy-tetrahydrodipicolinate synthase